MKPSTGTGWEARAVLVRCTHHLKLTSVWDLEPWSESPERWILALRPPGFLHLPQFCSPLRILIIMSFPRFDVSFWCCPDEERVCKAGQWWCHRAFGSPSLGIPPCREVSLDSCMGRVSWDLRSRGALCGDRCPGIWEAEENQTFPKNSPRTSPLLFSKLKKKKNLILVQNLILW